MTGSPLNIGLPLGPLFQRPAKVWEWSGQAADEGDEAAAWLTSFLGKPVRLVRYLGSLDPAASDAAATLAAEALAAGEGAAGADAGAAGALTREVDSQFVPWGAEVAFAGAWRGKSAMKARLGFGRGGVGFGCSRRLRGPVVGCA
jgi:hypothetical protein